MAARVLVAVLLVLSASLLVQGREVSRRQLSEEVDILIVEVDRPCGPGETGPCKENHVEVVTSEHCHKSKHGCHAPMSSPPTSPLPSPSPSPYGSYGGYGGCGYGGPSGPVTANNPNSNPSVPASCKYLGKNGNPCCDQWGNPCKIIEDAPDCCQSGDYTDSCAAKFYADGVDPINYQVTNAMGMNETKQCIYDGSSPVGHGRCYAPTLERNVWQGSQGFPQTVQLSMSFGTMCPIIMDSPITNMCLPGYGHLKNTPSGDINVYPSCAITTCKDGYNCAYNQASGHCKDSSCITGGQATIESLSPSPSTSLPSSSPQGSPTGSPGELPLSRPSYSASAS
ncbi:hypothetical protein WJX84_000318 [Apatococcus fuscideae]|uniref:Uncharacterized protein n=1 Tax=Apatococcus fuscideae TaxID=2026836 RepID=A0AAW1SX95_9CHLO